MNCVFFSVCAALVVGMVSGLIWPDSILLAAQIQTQCTIVESFPKNSTCCDSLNSDCSICTPSMSMCEIAVRDHIEGYCCDGTSCCLEWDDDECDEYGQRIEAIICGTCSEIDYVVSYVDTNENVHQQQVTAYCSRDNFDCYRFYASHGTTMACWYDVRSPEDSLVMSPIVYQWWQFVLAILAGCYALLFICGGVATLVPIIIKSARKQIERTKVNKANEARLRRLHQQARDLEREQDVFRTYVDVNQVPN